MRLVYRGWCFLLGEEAQGSRDLFIDVRYAARQEEFRARLTDDSGLTIKTVSTPEELHAEVFAALRDLPHTRSEAMLGTRVWNVPARSAMFTGREDLLDELRESLRSGGGDGGAGAAWHGWDRQDRVGNRVCASVW